VGGLADRAAALGYRTLLSLGADRVSRMAVDLALRLGPYGGGLRPWRSGVSVKRLRRSVHGVDLGPLESCLPERLPARSKRIELAPPELVAEMSHLRRGAGEVRPGLVLIGRRESRTLNSWSHNLPTLVKGPSRCLLEIHPTDAAARGVESGARVRVASRTGAVEVPARVTEAMMPGVVSLPHGYGHRGEGIALGVAAEHAGASINDLTDPAEIDSPSGNAVLSGVPVDVERKEMARRERLSEPRGSSAGSS
jgi:anaerobic selenocysteine-containing dehydrogenase